MNKFQKALLIGLLCGVGLAIVLFVILLIVFRKRLVECFKGLRSGGNSQAQLASSKGIPSDVIIVSHKASEVQVVKHNLPPDYRIPTTITPVQPVPISPTPRKVPRPQHVSIAGPQVTTPATVTDSAKKKSVETHHSVSRTPSSTKSPGPILHRKPSQLKNENASLGEVDFTVSYNYTARQLVVTIHQLKNLPRLKDSATVQGVMLRLTLMPEAMNVVYGKVTPSANIQGPTAMSGEMWQETFVFSEFPPKDLFQRQLLLELGETPTGSEVGYQALGAVETRLSSLLSSEKVPAVSIRSSRYFQPARSKNRNMLPQILIGTLFQKSTSALIVQFLQSRDLVASVRDRQCLRATVRLSSRSVKEETTNLQLRREDETFVDSFLTLASLDTDDLPTTSLYIEFVLESEEKSGKREVTKLGYIRIQRPECLQSPVEDGKLFEEWHTILPIA